MERMDAAWWKGTALKLALIFTVGAYGYKPGFNIITAINTYNYKASYRLDILLLLKLDILLKPPLVLYYSFTY